MRQQCREVVGYGEKVELLSITHPTFAGVTLTKMAGKYSLTTL